MTDKGPFSVVVIGIVRITTVYNIDYRDFSYSGTTASNWAFAESGIAIMTVCGPMLRPLFDRMMPKSFLSSRHMGTGGPGRFTRSHNTRKAYGQLQSHQIELVSGTGGESRALNSPIATVAPHSELEDELSIERALGGGRGRYVCEDDLEPGIHMQRGVTVTAG